MRRMVPPGSDQRDMPRVTSRIWSCCLHTIVALSFTFKETWWSVIVGGEARGVRFDLGSRRYAKNAALRFQFHIIVTGRRYDENPFAVRNLLAARYLRSGKPDFSPHRYHFPSSG